MPIPKPFSIRIFMPDGQADGLKVIEKSNWSGRGLVCPRALLMENKTREEFLKTGVYLLVGQGEEGGLPMLYIVILTTLSPASPRGRGADRGRELGLYFSLIISFEMDVADAEGFLEEVSLCSGRDGAPAPSVAFVEEDRRSGSCVTPRVYPVDMAKRHCLVIMWYVSRKYRFWLRM